MIDEQKLERAMNYLAETDETCAELKANVARTDYLAKVAEALAFNLCEGSNDVRKNEARVAAPVREAWEAHFSAMKAYEVVRARRERAILTIEVWRTISANRRLAA